MDDFNVTLEQMVALVGGLALLVMQLTHLMRTIKFEHTVNHKMDMLLDLREKKGYDAGQKAAQNEEARRDKIEETKPK